MPIGASFLGFFVSFILKSKNIFLLSLAVLYFSSLGVTADLLISYLEKPYQQIPLKKIKNANTIMVLGGIRELTNNSQGVIEWKDPDRFFAGIKLYKKGNSKRIIFSDGYSPFYGKNISEGEANKKYAISMGIPLNSILISGKANNTLQEAQELRKLFNKKNFLSNKIILVTSAFHMKRAKTLFEREGFKVFEFPVDFKTKCSTKRIIYSFNCLLPTADSLKNSSDAIREIVGRIVYKVY